MNFKHLPIALDCIDLVFDFRLAYALVVLNVVLPSMTLHHGDGGGGGWFGTQHNDQHTYVTNCT
jgi:hypothetical protein